MLPLLDVLAALSAQLLLAAALAWAAAFAGGRRHVRARAARAARKLRPAVPVAIAAGAGAWLIGRLTASAPSVEPVGMFVPGLATLLLAAASGGAWLVLAAGIDERRGRLRRARKGASLGGRAMFLGAAAAVVAWGVTYFALAPDMRRALVASGELAGQAGFGGVLVGFGGFVGLLAGLSGKPRPAGAFATAFYVLGLWLLFSAARAIGG